MAFKTKTAIGLEITSSRIKLVEIVSSALGMEITNFAVFNYPAGSKNSAEVAKQIKAAIGRTVLDTKEIYGVVSGPLVEHRIILLPPMTEQEINVVTRREADKVRHGESAFGMRGETALQDVSFGFDVVGQIEMGDVKKTAVLFVTAPYELVKEQMRIMKGLGICLRGLTIVPLALFHALGRAREYYNEDDVIAFIHAGTGSACIIMVGNNSLLFSREFQLPSGAELTETNYTGRLITEVKRTFLYFKQRYRGKEVSKGILSGDSRSTACRAPTGSISDMDLRNLASMLAKELDIGMEVFGIPACTERSERNGLGISLPQERLSEFQSLEPSLTIPIGLAIAGVRQSRINLLSQKGICGRGVSRIETILRVLSGVLLFMLFSSYLWISLTDFYTRRTKLVALNALESLRPELKNINEFEEERSEHAARLLLLERLNAPGPSASGGQGWSELFREISWLVPDDIVFNLLEARQEKGSMPRIIIECKTDAKGRFNEFLSYLRNSSSLSVLNSQKINPSFPRSSVGTSQNKVEGLHFLIECEVGK